MILARKVLIIGLVWPEPDTTAAGSRMMQLIRFFGEDHWVVHFASTAQRGQYTGDLDHLGVISHEIKLNDSSFDSWIEGLRPDVVIFDRFVTEEQFSWRVKENCNSAIRVLDTEDLHFLREARRLSLNGEGRDYRNFLLNEIAMRELASLFRSDLSLIISEFEFELLKEHFEIPEALLHYLPFLLDAEELEDRNSLPEFKQRKDFMCMGNWKHGPNKDAVLFLKEEIWPGIRRELPDARLHVYGAYGSGAELHLNDPGKGFLIRGWAASKREACSHHRVCLAPLRYGAGLKGKLVDSMRYGIPNVTTDIGAEGLGDDTDWNGFIANDPHEFSLRAVELYGNQKKWNDFQQKGFDLLNRRFRRETFEGDFKVKLNQLREHLKTRRSRNLTGALLWHHGALSTKYLSRWIEAKSKNQLQAPRNPGQTE